MSGSPSTDAVEPLAVYLPKVSSPCRADENIKSQKRAKPKKGKKEKKKSKEVEKILTEILYIFDVSQESKCERQEFDIDCDISKDGCFLDLEEEFPCALDFYDWKHGKVCRRKRLQPNYRHSRKYSQTNSYQATLDKVNYTNCEKKENLISYGNKKLKGSKVHLLKRELRKAMKKMSDVEYKKNNVEDRLKANNTPRRGPVGQQSGIMSVAHTSRQPIKSERNQYDQNNFILRNDNAADKFGGEELLTLISLQDREITPEDFDLLLQLDSFVEVKTVPKTVIDQLKTEKVENEMENPCMICMDEYEMGETVKHLKCGHFFHSSCIRTWLTVNSNKCPLDGQEVI